MSSSPGLNLAGGGSDSRSASGPREKRGGIKIQNPLPGPRRSRGLARPGSPAAAGQAARLQHPAGAQGSADLRPPSA